MRLRIDKGLFIAILVISLLLFNGIIAYADSFIMPEPSILESEDGTRMFVFNPYADDEYPAMGVYLMVEPYELIYPIDLGSMVFENDFYFSADMRYFVFIPTISQDIAIQFYGDGVLINSYRIPNLVEERDAVTFTVSMAGWHNRESRKLDIANNTFTLTTVDGLTYVFDITTGMAIEGEIIITDEVWSPFNYSQEQPPTDVTNILNPDDLVIEPPINIIEHGFLNPPLDGQTTITDVIVDFEEVEIVPGRQVDTDLVIGIAVMAIFGMSLVVALIIYKRKKS